MASLFNRQTYKRTVLSYFVLFLFYSINISFSEDGVYVNGTNETVPFPIYYNLKSILEVFHKEMVRL